MMRTDVGSGGWILISPINMQRLRSNPCEALGLRKICGILYMKHARYEVTEVTGSLRKVLRCKYQQMIHWRRFIEKHVFQLLAQLSAAQMNDVSFAELFSN